MRAVLGLVWHTVRLAHPIAAGFVQITDQPFKDLKRCSNYFRLTIIQLAISPFMTLPTSDGRPIPRIAIVSFLFSVLRTQYRIIAVVQTHG
jgi:hypothetical protein